MTLIHGLRYPQCVLTQEGLLLFISDAFVAIWTTIFSENAKCRKFGFWGLFDSQTYTGHTVQKLSGLRIFHTFRHVCGVWKIAKNDISLAKFCSVSLGILT